MVPAMNAQDYAALRSEMVQTQLRRRGISDPRVLAAMEEVPREEFVPADMRDSAYDDGAMPIGHGQTISQPYVVAYMAEAAQIQPDDKVLEIGTGSGYAAAVLSRLCREVHSVERIPQLEHEAHERLQRLGYTNVYTHVVDGTEGLISRAPYAAILVPAAASEVPEPLKDQLIEGGRLIIPIGERGGGQIMMRYTLQGRTLVYDSLGPFSFVPLIGEHGFREE
jgi:protein-L-isoaspartate(D-aspartate) O-methyltransferase